jgi:hypothetical protein
MTTSLSDMLRIVLMRDFNDPDVSFFNVFFRLRILFFLISYDIKNEI